METDDETLALAAANGDGEAFGLLLRRHYDRLFGLCCRLAGNTTEAEDLTQDICAALPAKLANFRGDAKFTTWLYRVAINASHDRRRRRATHARAANNWGDWELNRVAENEEAAQQSDWLATAISTLPVELRDTVILILGEELTQAQAGEILSVSEGTIAWRMSEVKKHLRAYHQKEGYP
ncbi:MULTISPECIES: RNA polymerase sigma factor [Halocynthiibacter]|uniref:RNA polymerase sigma factor n=1 Tax=Halocynthiibacter halioticoli TaxID=2986804 RepID=A0AAE3IWG4_9RHOB|nr:MULTISPECIES: RNA polymerase sigma factor [Halocynthiibacter]MCV6823405.1 RNA polymerase sigma factor [Halocynthiibacter halioticoli]MCW4056406.1 RNA polymerase sigma factor [Halocynthiibacter sp. SDUM655004]